MRLVIADTGPLNYLILIEYIGILPELFEKVVIPLAVNDELANPGSPLAVRTWIAAPPLWLEVRRTASRVSSVGDLGAGETEAIALAREIRADLLLMDDRRGVAVALQNGLTVTGTMGLLALAASRGLLDLASAFDRLRRTNFRYRQDLMDSLLGNLRTKP